MKTRPLIGISIYRNEPIDVRDEPGFNYCLTEAYPNMISRAGGIRCCCPTPLTHGMRLTACS